MRLRGQRRMQRNEIRAGEQIVELIDELDLQTAGACRGKIWVVSHDAHAESNSAATELTANASHSDNAESFIIELDAFEILAVPIAGAHARLGWRNSARDAKQKRKRVLGRRHCVSAGCIQDDDAAPRRGFNIDIIYADARATDCAQFAPGV